MSKIIRYVQKIKILFFMYICKFFAAFFPSKGWVICERGDEARDNAYWFYRYIKEYHPEQKVYYIIKNSSPDYLKVKDDSVELGSLKNYWVLANSEKIISTHYGSGLPIYDIRLFKACKLYKNFYFLQHGITQENLPALYKNAAPMNLFVCGAKKEYEYILKNFGHTADVVQYTGFARFDQLHDIKTKRQILVMPTWRGYIKNREQFESSDYYLRWQSFINSKALESLLEDKQIELIFYPHYEFQRYIDLFKTESKRVTIASKNDFDVQQLLKESELLITDYSSVFFDFAYMRKPVIYFQFDEEKYHKAHYPKGYFDFENMGFGDVCNSEEELMCAVTDVCGDNIELKYTYLKRAEEFFPLYDKCNCKRIYDLIVGENNEK